MSYQFTTTALIAGEDVQVDVEFSVDGADPSVGIMFEQVMIESVKDASGTELTVNGDDEDRLIEQCNDYYRQICDDDY